MKKIYLIGIMLIALIGSGVVLAAGNTYVLYLPIIFMPPPENPNKIIFSSDREGLGTQLYTMNQDGSNVIQFTNNAGDNDEARWSPDWKKIAFRSSKDGNLEVYIMNVDGSGEIRLTNDPANDGGPDWSPDGKQIVFASNRNGEYGLYIINVDGSELHQIGNFYGFMPSWSPDGKKIAFSDGLDIFVVNIDGTSLINITNAGLGDYAPEWSPDGTQIGFVGDIRGKDVFVIPSNGGEITRLTNSTSDHCCYGSPSWRGDGKVIVYSDWVGPAWYNYEIFVYDIDSRIATRITNNDSSIEYEPYFTP
jgi:Tol biopolymer transport system component